MKWLTPDQRGKVETWLDSGWIPKGHYGPRQRLVVAIALESGLRQSEILMLRHDQANVTNNRWEAVLRLKRKDRARVDAAMGPRSKRIYLELFPEPAVEEEPIFRYGPTPSGVYKFFRKLGDHLGIEKLSPHQLRHTLGRDMAKAGYSPSDIQKALGHKSGATALIYFESTPDEAIDAALSVRGG